MCSEQIFNGDMFADLAESKRLDICLSIFYCLNWFRELVSECKVNQALAS